MARPIEEIYNLNWDATTKNADGRIDIGVITRNFKGQVFGTLRAPRKLSKNDFIAKAYALLVV